MSWQLYTNTLAQLPSNTTIVPFFRGESMLHPQFVDAMKELERFNTVQLATNGDKLNHANTAAILNTCSFISLSAHSFVKSNTNWNTFLHLAKNEGITTQISIVETLIPKGQKQQFINSWLKHADRVRIYVEHSHIGYGDTTLNLKDDGQPCSRPFTEIVSYWDGKVALCCQDWNNHIPLGNLNEQSLESVWTSQVYKDIRLKHQMGNRKTISSCINCHQWTSSQVIGEIYEQ